MSTALYLTPPPDVPMFVYKLYTVSSIHSLIEWSKKEYKDVLNIYAKRGDFRSFKWVNENCSPMLVLAKMKNFRAILAQLNTEKVWNRLSREDKRFIVGAYELYEMLQKSSQLVQ